MPTIVRPVDLSQLKNWVVSEVIPSVQKNPESQTFAEEQVRYLFETGILQAVVPKHLGGPDLKVTELINIIRTISYGSPSVAATMIGNLLGLSAIVMYAEPQLMERLSLLSMSEFLLWSFAMTEGEVGSDLKNIRTTAVQKGDHWILNGEKNFITNATYSKHMVVFANVTLENGEKAGVSCFYVPGNAEGLERGDIMDKVAWKQANTGTLKFHNIQLPRNYLLGELGSGLKILTHCLNRSKTLLGAMAVGICDRAIDLSVERLSTTQRFGKPLVEQPHVRHLLGEMHAKKTAAWFVVENAAKTWDAGLPAVTEASMAKYFGGRVGIEITNECMEFFGARGLFNDFEISRLHREVKAVEIIEGPAAVQELLISKGLLDSYTSKAEKENKSKDVFHLGKKDLRRSA